MSDKLAEYIRSASVKSPYIGTGRPPRIGYVPYTRNLSHPADRRRFPFFAKARGIEFELAQTDRHYDAVILSEIADLSTWTEYKHGKVIYDLIDSYLDIPRHDPKQFLRGVAWFVKGSQRRPIFDFPGALARMCRRADAVVCTTAEQRQTILRFCLNVHVVLDIHTDLVTTSKSDYQANAPFKLVWDGMPSNAYQLATISSALRKVSRSFPIQLVLVTDVEQPRTIPWFGSVKTDDIARRIFENWKVCPWRSETWADTITQCDIAVIPIDLKNPLTAGKPGNKLALLWRAGMPVVTSDTPSYKRMQTDVGLSHLACHGEADWVSALEILLGDEGLRRQAGQRGREYVDRVLSTSAQLQAWDDVLSSIGIELAGTTAGK
jgi:glycosyltransferase involved in cell wall biosynthesis